MKLHTLYLGLITRANTAVKPHAKHAILADTAKTFGGYTVVSATGGWTDANGFTSEEPSIRIEVITDADLATVRAWAERARLLANQESVYLTSQPITADLIGPTVPIVEHSEESNHVVH